MAKTKETTVCDQPSMLGITIMLADIMQQLQNAKEMAEQAQEKIWKVTCDNLKKIQRY